MAVVLLDISTRYRFPSRSYRHSCIPLLILCSIPSYLLVVSPIVVQHIAHSWGWGGESL